MSRKLRDSLRLIRLTAHHDRRALKQEAERTADDLARWAHATESWVHGEIAEAHRSAEVGLQTSPDDFDLIRICLDYHIRARDSVQIYEYAKRLLAAKNPAATLRRLYAVVSLVLWPLWLLGYRKGRSATLADNCDNWVAWSRNYVAKHFDQFAAAQSADSIPIVSSAIAGWSAAEGARPDSELLDRVRPLDFARGAQTREAGPQRDSPDAEGDRAQGAESASSGSRRGLATKPRGRTARTVTCLPSSASTLHKAATTRLIF